MAVTYTDRQLLKRALVGLLAAMGLSDAIAEVGKSESTYFFWDKAADDGMASTTTSETFTGVYSKYAAILKSITYSPTTGGVTADAANYATVTASKRDSAGANKTTLGTLTTTIASSGNLTQGAGKAFVLTNANVALSAGSTFTWEIAKTGTGVVMRAGRFTAEVEWD